MLSTVAPLLLRHCPSCQHFDCNCPASSALSSATSSPTKQAAVEIARAHRKRIRVWRDQVSACFSSSPPSPPPTHKPGMFPEPNIKNTLSLITHQAVSHAIPNITRRENEAVRARSRSRGRKKASGAGDQRQRSKSAGVPSAGVPRETGRTLTGEGISFQIDCGYDTEPRAPIHNHKHHHHHHPQRVPSPEEALLTSPIRTSTQPLQQPIPYAPARNAKVLSDAAFLSPPTPRYAASESALSLVTTDSSAVPASTVPTTADGYQMPVPPAAVNIRIADVDLRTAQAKQFQAIQLKHMELAQAKEDIMQDAKRKAGQPVGPDDVIMTEQDRERERNAKNLARNKARNDQFKRAREAREAALKARAGGA